MTGKLRNEICTNENHTETGLKQDLNRNPVDILNNEVAQLSPATLMPGLMESEVPQDFPAKVSNSRSSTMSVKNNALDAHTTYPAKVKEEPEVVCLDDTSSPSSSMFPSDDSQSSSMVNMDSIKDFLSIPDGKSPNFSDALKPVLPVERPPPPPSPPGLPDIPCIDSPLESILNNCKNIDCFNGCKCTEESVQCSSSQRNSSSQISTGSSLGLTSSESDQVSSDVAVHKRFSTRSSKSSNVDSLEPCNNNGACSASNNETVGGSSCSEEAVSSKTHTETRSSVTRSQSFQTDEGTPLPCIGEEMFDDDDSMSLPEINFKGPVTGQCSASPLKKSLSNVSQTLEKSSPSFLNCTKDLVTDKRSAGMSSSNSESAPSATKSVPSEGSNRVVASVKFSNKETKSKAKGSPAKAKAKICLTKVKEKNPLAKVKGKSAPAKVKGGISIAKIRRKSSVPKIKEKTYPARVKAKSCPVKNKEKSSPKKNTDRSYSERSTRAKLRRSCHDPKGNMNGVKNNLPNKKLGKPVTDSATIGVTVAKKVSVEELPVQTLARPVTESEIIVSSVTGNQSVEVISNSKNAQPGTESEKRDTSDERKSCVKVLSNTTLTKPVSESKRKVTTDEGKEFVQGRSNKTLSQPDTEPEMMVTSAEEKKSVQDLSNQTLAQPGTESGIRVTSDEGHMSGQDLSHQTLAQPVTESGTKVSNDEGNMSRQDLSPQTLAQPVTESGTKVSIDERNMPVQDLSNKTFFPPVADSVISKGSHKSVQDILNQELTQIVPASERTVASDKVNKSVQELSNKELAKSVAQSVRKVTNDDRNKSVQDISNESLVQPGAESAKAGTSVVRKNPLQDMGCRRFKFDADLAAISIDNSIDGSCCISSELADFGVSQTPSSGAVESCTSMKKLETVIDAVKSSNSVENSTTFSSSVKPDSKSCVQTPSSPIPYMAVKCPEETASRERSQFSPVRNLKPRTRVSSDGSKLDSIINKLGRRLSLELEKQNHSKPANNSEKNVNVITRFQPQSSSGTGGFFSEKRSQCSSNSRLLANRVSGSTCTNSSFSSSNQDLKLVCSENVSSANKKNDCVISCPSVGSTELASVQSAVGSVVPMDSCSNLSSSLQNKFETTVKAFKHQSSLESSDNSQMNNQSVETSTLSPNKNLNSGKVLHPTNPMNKFYNGFCKSLTITEVTKSSSNHNFAPTKSKLAEATSSLDQESSQSDNFVKIPEVRTKGGFRKKSLSPQKKGIQSFLDKIYSKRKQEFSGELSSIISQSVSALNPKLDSSVTVSEEKTLSAPPEMGVSTETVVSLHDKEMVVVGSTSGGKFNDDTQVTLSSRDSLVEFESSTKSVDNVTKLDSSGGNETDPEDKHGAGNSFDLFGKNGITSKSDILSDLCLIEIDKSCLPLPNCKDPTSNKLPLKSSDENQCGTGAKLLLKNLEESVSQDSGLLKDFEAPCIIETVVDSSTVNKSQVCLRSDEYLPTVSKDGESSEDVDSFQNSSSEEIEVETPFCKRSEREDSNHAPQLTDECSDIVANQEFRLDEASCDSSMVLEDFPELPPVCDSYLDFQLAESPAGGMESGSYSAPESTYMKKSISNVAEEEPCSSTSTDGVQSFPGLPSEIESHCNLQDDKISSSDSSNEVEVGATSNLGQSVTKLCIKNGQIPTPPMFSGSQKVTPEISGSVLVTEVVGFSTPEVITEPFKSPEPCEVPMPPNVNKVSISPNVADSINPIQLREVEESVGSLNVDESLELRRMKGSFPSPKVEESSSVEKSIRPTKVRESPRSTKVRQSSRSAKLRESSRFKKGKELPRGSKEKRSTKLPDLEDSFKLSEEDQSSPLSTVKESSTQLWVEKTSIPPRVEESSTSPMVAESSESSRVEESSKSPRVQESAVSQMVQESSKSPIKENSSTSSIKEKSFKLPTVVGAFVLARVNEASTSPTMKEPSSSMTVDESFKSQTVIKVPPSLSVKEFSSTSSVSDLSTWPEVRDSPRSASVEDSWKSPLVHDVSKCLKGRDSSRSSKVRCSSRSPKTQDSSKSPKSRDSSKSPKSRDSSKSPRTRDTSRSPLTRESSRYRKVKDSSLSSKDKNKLASSKLIEFSSSAVKKVLFPDSSVENDMLVESSRLQPSFSVSQTLRVIPLSLSQRQQSTEELSKTEKQVCVTRPITTPELHGACFQPPVLDDLQAQNEKCQPKSQPNEMTNSSAVATAEELTSSSVKALEFDVISPVVEQCAPESSMGGSEVVQSGKCHADVPSEKSPNVSSRSTMSETQEPNTFDISQLQNVDRTASASEVSGLHSDGSTFKCGHSSMDLSVSDTVRVEVTAFETTHDHESRSKPKNVDSDFILPKNQRASKLKCSSEIDSSSGVSCGTSECSSDASMSKDFNSETSEDIETVSILRETVSHPFREEETDNRTSIQKKKASHEPRQKPEDHSETIGQEDTQNVASPLSYPTSVIQYVGLRKSPSMVEIPHVTGSSIGNDQDVLMKCPAAISLERPSGKEVASREVTSTTSSIYSSENGDTSIVAERFPRKASETDGKMKEVSPSHEHDVGEEEAKTGSCSVDTNTPYAFTNSNKIDYVIISDSEPEISPQQYFNVFDKTHGSRDPSPTQDFLSTLGLTRNNLTLSQKLTASQFKPPVPGTRRSRRSIVYPYKTDTRIVEMTGDQLCEPFHAAVESQKRCSLSRGGKCKICDEQVPSLDRHVADAHICLSYRPFQKTLAYHHHTQERYLEFPKRYSDAHYGKPYYLCFECDLATDKMEVAWAHQFEHVYMYQVNECGAKKSECRCVLQVCCYSLPKYRRYLMESAKCNICGSRFSCEKGLKMHFECVHVLKAACRSCSETSIDCVLTHNSTHICPSPGEVSNEVTDFNYISENALQNQINYTDGRKHRINIHSRGAASTDRSHFKLPLVSAPEFVELEEVNRNKHGMTLNKYKQGKRTLKVSVIERNLATNFDVPIQFIMQKKFASCRRPRKPVPPNAYIGKRILPTLGLKRIASSKPEPKEVEVEPVRPPSPVPKKPARKSRSAANTVGETVVEEKQTEEETKLKTTEATNDVEKAADQNDAPAIPLITGEWGVPHTYVCCACGHVEGDLMEIMDHKWERHTGVLCSHTMMQDNPGAPVQFCHQYQPPRYVPVAADASPEAKRKPVSKGKKKSGVLVNKAEFKCTKCAEEFVNAVELHMHIVVCGGLAKLYTSKFIKKSKKTPRFRRRRGQVTQGRHSGASSSTNTPRKLAEVGVGTVAALGVKRRLEGAINSIDNSVLKRRLKDVIKINRAANKPRPNVNTGPRKCGRMRLRKQKQLPTGVVRDRRPATVGSIVSTNNTTVAKPAASKESTPFPTVPVTRRTRSVVVSKAASTGAIIKRKVNRAKSILVQKEKKLNDKRSLAKATAAETVSTPGLLTKDVADSQLVPVEKLAEPKDAEVVLKPKSVVAKASIKARKKVNNILTDIRNRIASSRESSTDSSKRRHVSRLKNFNRISVLSGRSSKAGSPSSSRRSSVVRSRDVSLSKASSDSRKSSVDLSATPLASRRTSRGASDASGVKITERRASGRSKRLSKSVEVSSDEDEVLASVKARLLSAAPATKTDLAHASHKSKRASGRIEVSSDDNEFVESDNNKAVSDTFTHKTVGPLKRKRVSKTIGFTSDDDDFVPLLNRQQDYLVTASKADLKRAPIKPKRMSKNLVFSSDDDGDLAESGAGNNHTKTDLKRTSLRAKRVSKNIGFSSDEDGVVESDISKASSITSTGGTKRTRSLRPKLKKIEVSSDDEVVKFDGTKRTVDNLSKTEIRSTSARPKRLARNIGVSSEDEQSESDKNKYAGSTSTLTEDHQTSAQPNRVTRSLEVSSDDEQAESSKSKNVGVNPNKIDVGRTSVGSKRVSRNLKLSSVDGKPIQSDETDTKSSDDENLVMHSSPRRLRQRAARPSSDDESDDDGTSSFKNMRRREFGCRRRRTGSKRSAATKMRYSFRPPGSSDEHPSEEESKVAYRRPIPKRQQATQKEEPVSHGLPLVEAADELLNELKTSGDVIPNKDVSTPVKNKKIATSRKLVNVSKKVLGLSKKSKVIKKKPMVQIISWPTLPDSQSIPTLLQNPDKTAPNLTNLPLKLRMKEQRRLAMSPEMKNVEQLDSVQKEASNDVPIPNAAVVEGVVADSDEKVQDTVDAGLRDAPPAVERLAPVVTTPVKKAQNKRAKKLVKTPADVGGDMLVEGKLGNRLCQKDGEIKLDSEPENVDENSLLASKLLDSDKNATTLTTERFIKSKAPRRLKKPNKPKRQVTQKITQEIDVDDLPLSVWVKHKTVIGSENVLSEDVNKIQDDVTDEVVSKIPPHESKPNSKVERLLKPPSPHKRLRPTKTSGKLKRKSAMISAELNRKVLNEEVDSHEPEVKRSSIELRSLVPAIAKPNVESVFDSLPNSDEKKAVTEAESSRPTDESAEVTDLAPAVQDSVPVNTKAKGAVPKKRKSDSMLNEESSMGPENKPKRVRVTKKTVLTPDSKSDDYSSETVLCASTPTDKPLFSNCSGKGKRRNSLAVSLGIDSGNNVASSNRKRSRSSSDMATAGSRKSVKWNADSTPTADPSDITGSDETVSETTIGDGPSFYDSNVTEVHLEVSTVTGGPVEVRNKSRMRSTGRVLKAHVPLGELRCRACGLLFDSIDAYNTHDKDVCANIVSGLCLIPEEQIYECHYCQLTFVNKARQKRHTAACRAHKQKRPNVRTVPSGNARTTVRAKNTSKSSLEDSDVADRLANETLGSSVNEIEESPRLSKSSASEVHNSLSFVDPEMEIREKYKQRALNKGSRLPSPVSMQSSPVKKKATPGRKPKATPDKAATSIKKNPRKKKGVLVDSSPKLDVKLNNSDSKVVSINQEPPKHNDLVVDVHLPHNEATSNVKTPLPVDNSSSPDNQLPIQSASTSPPIDKTPSLLDLGLALQDLCVNDISALEMTTFMLQYRLCPNQTRDFLNGSLFTLNKDGDFNSDLNKSSLPSASSTVRDALKMCPYMLNNTATTPLVVVCMKFNLLQASPPEEHYPGLGFVTWCSLLQELVNQQSLVQMQRLLMDTARRQKDNERSIEVMGENFFSSSSQRCVALPLSKEQLLQAVSGVEGVVKLLGNLKVEALKKDMLSTMKNTFEKPEL